MNTFKLSINQNRIFGLDILRAIAILMVIFGHGNHILNPHFNTGWSSWFILDGVGLFFVLSGYLIGRILIRDFESKGASINTLMRFWIRRWFRTLPVYFLVLILLAIIYHFYYKYELPNLGEYLIFSQNLAWVHPSFFSEAWSLSVEEWFYLITPILIFVVASFHISPKRSIIVVVVIIIAASTGMRFFRYSQDIVHTLGDWDVFVRKQVVTGLDRIMFGVLGAFFSYYHTDLLLKYRRVLFTAGILLILFTHYMGINMDLFFSDFTVYYVVFSFSIFSIGVMFLLPLMSSIRTGQGILYGFLTRISMISYSMYLLHFNMVMFFALPIYGRRMPNLDGETKTLILYGLYWISTIAGSVLLYKYWELPMMNLRDKVKIKPFLKMICK